MRYGNGREHIGEFYEFAMQEGFSEEWFLTATNLRHFIETAIDAYREYPLFARVFGGTYDEKTLRRMMTVDFKSRFHRMAGVTGSGQYESVLIMETPNREKTGMLQYVKVAGIRDYTMLFHPATYRQGDYEKYALAKRSPYMDARTWYVYVFATKRECQRQGYGKKLMKLLLSFADQKGYRICLETNLRENVPLYEAFGFRLMDTDTYKGELDHFVMLYEKKE